MSTLYSYLATMFSDEQRDWLPEIKFERTLDCIKAFHFMKELGARFELLEKPWHHAFSIFMWAFNKSPKMSFEELKEVALVASEIAIKFHDVDERVQLLE